MQSKIYSWDKLLSYTCSKRLWGPDCTWDDRPLVPENLKINIKAIEREIADEGT
jgi:hypothetical protein